MTETREQWIEREARKALVTYNSGSDFWDDHSFEYQERWRSVVAPYYPEPLRVPVDVDGLADAICNAASRESEHYLCAEWNATSYRDSFRAAARAALAYLSVEPCAKPEYDPDDMAFRDALKRSQEIVNNWTPEQRNHNSIGYAGLQDNERNELENLRAEGGRLREEVANLLVEISKTNSKAERQRQALDANRKTIESRGAEIARLENVVKRLRTQQPETRPVNVRFDVTVEDLAAKIHHALHGGWPELSQESDRTKAVWIDTAQIAMDYLASHAVLEASAGVSREWREEDVEALAKAMYETSDAYGEAWKWDDGDQYAKNTTRKEARAALAWFDGKRGEV